MSCLDGFYDLNDFYGFYDFYGFHDFYDSPFTIYRLRIL